MFVKDIYNDVKQVTGFTDQVLNFGRITDGVEVLSNKGQFDALLGYLDIGIQDGNIVTLPREVLVPIKVNVDNIPSFSRDRLYEFTLNGPGSSTERSDFSWEDRGAVPTMVPLPSPTTLKAVTTSTFDNGKKIFIYGKDSSGVEISDTLILNNAITPTTTNVYASITRIYKETTIDKVLLKTVSNVLLSTYYPDENEPAYRQIRLSKTGVTAHLLIRRNVFRVTTMDDYIPVASKMALLIMIKALEAYRRSDFTTAQGLETQAVSLAVEDQKVRNSFIELAGISEVDTARNLNYNNADTIIVADIYDDVAKIVGKIGEPNIFSVITEAVGTLDNKSIWDGSEGIVDIKTDQFYYLTLPRYVEVPIQINICGEPQEPRNKWFEFHLNGPGSNMPLCRGWADVGETVTFRDVNYPQQLTAVPDLTSDVNTAIRVFGYYQGKRIMTLNGGTGKMEDGFPVTCNMSGIPLATAQFVDRIERITKAESNGFINLIGYDAGRNVSVPIGYYWPDETEPTYRRIKLSQSCAWIRMRYRRRSRKVTSLTDPLHMKSKTAIIMMVQALEAFKKPETLEAGKSFEAKALELANEAQMARNPNQTWSFQVPTTYGSDRVGNIS